MLPNFEPFPKMPRLSRDIVVTEKIDGTNAQIFITEEMEIYAGSRNRWLTVKDDNFGFARWVDSNLKELLELGPGRHFGEWWGCGIQRGYGLTEKRFSLFNTARWKYDNVPACCSVVPVLYEGDFILADIDFQVFRLEMSGSLAAPGYMKPEGIVIFHTAANLCFKKTIEKDEMPKTQQQKEVIAL